MGFVAGRGSAPAPSAYRFTDANGFQGLSYYRLRQLDFDGAAIHSDVRAVAGLSVGTHSSLTVFPSPATLTVEAAGPVPAGLQLALVAADGRLIRQLDWPAGQRQLPLTVEKLTIGGYWLRYTANGQSGTLKILVAH